MTFPLFEIDVRLDPTFVAAVDDALQSGQAELVLLRAVTADHGLYIAADYLKTRARAIALAGARTVIVVDSTASDICHAQVLDACKPGDLVLCAELRPACESRANAVNVAAQFVGKGATVLGSIHGCDARNAEARLGRLWQAAIAAGELGKGAVLPAYRLVRYAGEVKLAPGRP